jgi:hypothetical protein
MSSTPLSERGDQVGRSILHRAFTNFIQLFLKHSPGYHGVDWGKELALSSSSGNSYTNETAWGLLFDPGIREIISRYTDTWMYCNISKLAPALRKSIPITCAH